MKELSFFDKTVDFVLTDIDDTLTDEGRLGPEAYSALWKLQKSGVQVIPVTGRPAGWCELIARQWPVAGVVGENGGFYFLLKEYLDGNKTKILKRKFVYNDQDRAQNARKLDKIRDEVLAEVPGCAVASDQFCRTMDLAIDFCEDVKPLAAPEVEKIVKVFTRHGATAKVSSIHVNGWFGTYDKLQGSLDMLMREFNVTQNDAKSRCVFVGDSPNDEPMFKYFPLSFGVANIKNFSSSLINPPAFVAKSRGGKGFAEVAERIIAVKKK